MLWPSKPDAGNALDPYQAEIAGFGLAPVNYLAGVAGLYAGYMTAPWLMVFLAFLGVAWGVAERWMLARVTPARLVMLAGLRAGGAELRGRPSHIAGLAARGCCHRGCGVAGRGAREAVRQRGRQ